MPGKHIRFRSRARRRLLRGADALAGSVRVTLGPKGRNVAIERILGPPRVTKDGVSVAHEIELADKIANIGVRLIREAATHTAGRAGDGTTTATVLAHAILHEGIKVVASGVNPMDVKRGIDLAVSAVAAHLKSRAKSIGSPAVIAQIATVAANGDEAVGRLMADATSAVGLDGLITLEEGKSLATELEIVDGMQFDTGYISHYFITDAQKMMCELDAPFILLHETRLTEFDTLVPLLEAVVKAGKPLLIVAEDVEAAPLAALVVNHLRGGLKLAAVKAPGAGPAGKALLRDIAALTGGQIIGGEAGMPLGGAGIEALGRAKRVTVERARTSIIDGAGDKRDIRARIAEIKGRMAATKYDYERHLLRERLAKLTGGVAIIRVGGATEVEVQERKDRVQNALNATRAALAEGVVPGGGAALLHAAAALAELDAANPDQKAGIDIVRRALSAPLRQIAKNAGADGALVAARLLDQARPDWGFDAQRSAYVDMFAAGVIDPAKVVRLALQQAASIAGLLITTEAVIA